MRFLARFASPVAVVAAVALLAPPREARSEPAARADDDRAAITVNPCATPDPGFGVYDRWEPVALGQMIAPHRGGVARDGGFDLVVHFHGHEPARKEFVKVARGPVLVGIDLGIGSGAYETAFASPDAFARVLSSVEDAMRRRSGRANAHVRRLALESWSAGYGATAQILRQPLAAKVDAVVLLDSLHAGYTDADAHAVDGARLAPFVARARAAVGGKGVFFLSHSSIVPPGYASTTEVARWLVGQVGGAERAASRRDVLGLRMLGRFDRGNLHVRGYAGDDKPDHCAHLGLVADVMKAWLAPRWKSPVGRGS